jgi:hypothetical protein
MKVHGTKIFIKMAVFWVVALCSLVEIILPLISHFIIHNHFQFRKISGSHGGEQSGVKMAVF